MKRQLVKSSSLGSGRVVNGRVQDYIASPRKHSTISTVSSSSSLLSIGDESIRSPVFSQQFEYNPKTGLPIFNIDECSDDELLGGEPLFAGKTRDEELQAVHELRRQLSAEEKAQLTDPRMLIRHWRAEKGNTFKALQTIREALQWRREFEADALRVCMSNHPGKAKGRQDYKAMMELENATGKIFVRGTNLEGRALMYMFAMRNNTNNDMDNMRHLVWNLEKAIRVTQAKSQGRLDKYCLMIDCSNFLLRKSPSMQASKMTLDVLQKHFKERMHRIYVLNPPMAFRMFWKLVQPFIDPVTKTKIVFCSGPQSEGTEQLRKDVGPEQAKRLEECAHGTEPIRPFDSTEYLSLPMEVPFDD